MVRKPKRSHQAFTEIIIIITHGKINGRATVNLIINILDSHTNHSSRLKKAKVKKKHIYYYL